MDGNAELLGGLNDILGLRIRLAHGAVYLHFTETFAELDLTQKQVSALWLVHDNPGISLGRLSVVNSTYFALLVGSARLSRAETG